MSHRPLRSSAVDDDVHNDHNGPLLTDDSFLQTTPQRPGHGNGNGNDHYHAYGSLTTGAQHQRYAYDANSVMATPIDKTLLSPNESLNELFSPPTVLTQHSVMHHPNGGSYPPPDLNSSDAPKSSDKKSLATPSKHPRLISLDAFRGLTIIWMIMADEMGGIWNSIFDHSPWDEIRFSDFVFPLFVFIVGMAIPMSTRKASLTIKTRIDASKKIVWRAAKLWFIGWFTGDGFPVSWNLSMMRIPGILQRIACSYFFTALIHVWIPVRELEDQQEHEHAQLGGQQPDYPEIDGEDGKKEWSERVKSALYVYRKYLWQIVAALTFLLIYLILTFGTHVPGCKVGDIRTAGCSAARYWDREILGYSHMYGQPTISRAPECSSCYPAFCPRPDRPTWCDEPFDPEGIVSSFGAIVSCCIGLLFGKIIEEYKTHDARLKQWLGFSVISFIFGLIIHFSCMPMNKNIWSLSFIFAMGGIDGFIFSFFYYLIDVKGKKKFLYPMICMGMNAILIFLCSERGLEVDNYIQGMYVNNNVNSNLITWYQDWLGSKFGSNWGWSNDLGAGFLWAVIKGIVWLGISTVLAHYRIFWKI